MNHVRVTTVSGAEVDIPHAEVERVMRSMNKVDPHTKMEELNEHYHNKAYHNICEHARLYGIRDIDDHEDDIKDVLQVAIEEHDSDLMGEIIEWFISDHARKVKA